jgi:hypothetical protein
MPEAASARNGRLTELALWLTEAEAETLVGLALVSPGEGGPAEPALFAKLGELLRAFREPAPTP